MKITDVKIIVCSPGRNFVTVKIFTDEGLTGVGDATLNGREKAVVAYLQDHLVPLLIGRDPSRIEDIWQYFYRGAYWRRGPVTMAAIAGIDTALWDIKAKAANMPLYQLLGGASREKVLCYTHAQGRDIAEAVEAVGKRKEQGYKAIRVQVGIPGLPDVYGTGAKSVTNNALDDALPHEETWSTSKYLRYVPELFKAVREAHGWDIELLHDTHHRLTPIEAARLGKDLEFARLFWLEDAVAAEHQEGFRLDPQAHHDAARRRRGVQHHLGCAAAHGGAAHRLHPHDDRPCRRRDGAPPHHGFRERLQCPHRLPRRDGHVADLPRRQPASRPVGPEFRHPGIFRLSRRRSSKSSRAPGAFPTAICTRARPSATASISTRNLRRNTPTSAPICR